MKLKLEELTPQEIRSVIERRLPVFIPIAPLEWHSFHLPYGTDPLNAEAIAFELARRLGGVVHPTMFMGTEVPRKAQEKEWLGLASVAQEVIGMDFPGFPVKSLYWRPEVFEAAIRELLRGLKRVGFDRIVLVNGHGADRQCSILKNVAQEMTDERCRILYVFPFLDAHGKEQRLPGHADLLETSITMANYPDLVHIEFLPTTEDLPYEKYGIVDSAAFNGKPAPDFVCPEESDPRKATAEMGRKFRDRVIKYLSLRLRDLLSV